MKCTVERRHEHHPRHQSCSSNITQHHNPFVVLLTLRGGQLPGIPPHTHLHSSTNHISHSQPPGFTYHPCFPFSPSRTFHITHLEPSMLMIYESWLGFEPATSQTRGNAQPHEPQNLIQAD